MTDQFKRSAPIAVLRKVTKGYGPVVALDGIDLEIRKGEVLALLGPNGAGKTTSVRLVLGLCRADAGDVEVFGSSPLEAGNRMRTGAMMQIGKVPETLRVGDLSGGQKQRLMTLRGSARSVTLRIHDNGLGIREPEGAGLKGMRERVEAAGGTLERTTEPGTTIVIEMPVERHRSTTRMEIA